MKTTILPVSFILFKRKNAVDSYIVFSSRLFSIKKLEYSNLSHRIRFTVVNIYIFLFSKDTTKLIKKNGFLIFVTRNKNREKRRKESAKNSQSEENSSFIFHFSHRQFMISKGTFCNSLNSILNC